MCNPVCSAKTPLIRACHNSPTTRHNSPQPATTCSQFPEVPVVAPQPTTTHLASFRVCHNPPQPTYEIHSPNWFRCLSSHISVSYCLLPLLLLLAPRELLLNAAPAASSPILAFVAAARYEVPSQLYPRIEKLQMPYVPNWCFSTPTPCFFKNGRLRLRTRTVPWYTVRTRNHSINRMKLIELIKWIRNVINHG